MKPVRINENPVIVRAKHPSDAWEVISTHKDTTRGRRNAYDSAVKARLDHVRIFYYGKENTIREWEEPAGLWM